jgi:prolyl-tRNA synthetase
MRQSQLFGRTSKTLTKDAVSASHELLVRAGFINQLTSGVWSFLPLGRMVYKNIEEIVRQSLNAIGCQEVSLPSLIPSDLWKETDRWTTMDPPLFKVKDRHEKWYGLGSTHEEVIADLARKYIFSYKDLPQALYQIQK